MALSITKSKDRYGKTIFCVGDAYFYTEAKARKRLAELGGRERKAAPKVTFSEDIKRGYFIDKYGIKRSFDDADVTKYLELRANPRRYKKGEGRYTETAMRAWLARAADLADAGLGGYEVEMLGPAPSRVFKQKKLRRNR